MTTHQAGPELDEAKAGRVSVSSNQAESDEEIALGLATWLRSEGIGADGSPARKIAVLRAEWLEEMADRANAYRCATVAVAHSCR